MKTQENEVSHGTVNETTNSQLNSELVEFRTIETTPFTAVRVEEKWFLTMGKYRLSGQLDSFEQVLEESKDASWDRIVQVIQAMIESNKDLENLKTN